MRSFKNLVGSLDLVELPLSLKHLLNKVQCSSVVFLNINAVTSKKLRYLLAYFYNFLVNGSCSGIVPTFLVEDSYERFSADLDSRDC